MNRGVILSLETSGEKRDEINRGLLSEGMRLSKLLDGPLSVIAVGYDAEPETLENYGVSTVFNVRGERLSEYSPEVYSCAFKEALKDIPFRLLLFAHTDRGSELAPRVAASLDTMAVCNCADIYVKGTSLAYVRLVYGGQFTQEVRFRNSSMEVASINPEVLDIREGAARSSLNIVVLAVNIPPHVTGPISLGVIPPDYRTVDILYAKRIIGAGAGCESRLMAFVEELSHLLEGSIGTTRPVVDDGYLPKARMIGQTGKTVVPDLYIALGISGSPHHVSGIQQARKILSVNKDPRAPVFDVSDTGFVCDLTTLLPKLIDRINQYKGSA